jgi:hypothetical protein
VLMVTRLLSINLVPPADWSSAVYYASELTLFARFL